MNKIIVFLIFFTFHFLFFTSVLAQEQGAPFIRHYSYKEYDGSAQTWCAVQDKRGMMYFGDNTGVIEFDGNTWRRIFVQKEQVVRSLAIDSTGRIYVGSINEFGYLQPDSIGKMQYISLSDRLPKKDQVFLNVWSTISTPQGVYFFSPNYIFRFYIIKKSKRCEIKKRNG